MPTLRGNGLFGEPGGYGENRIGAKVRQLAGFPAQCDGRGDYQGPSVGSEGRHSFQCTISSGGWRVAGLKSVPLV